MLRVFCVRLVVCVLALWAELAMPAAAQPAPSETFTQPEATPDLPSGANRFSNPAGRNEEGSNTARADEDGGRRSGVGRRVTRNSEESRYPSRWFGAPENVAAMATCGLIIFGGLIIFAFLIREWNQLALQTLGTIFFFPTLILLGIYIDLSRDAVTTLLGAFVGYLFNQSRGSRLDGRDGDRDGGEPRPRTPRGTNTSATALRTSSVRSLARQLAALVRGEVLKFGSETIEKAPRKVRKRARKRSE
jgi:hypothetical protein